MTRLPGDFPHEGKARHAVRRRAQLAQSRPEAQPFAAYRQGDLLACTACGNRVEVQSLGGGRIACCGQPMTLWGGAEGPGSP